MVFFVSCFEGRVDCVSELVCSSDSFDEVRLFGLEGILVDMGDFLFGYGVLVFFEFREVC